MKESDDQRVAHAAIKSAIEHLNKVVNIHNAAFVGYAWGVDPVLLIKFGNVTETGPDATALLLKLEDMANQKIDEGLVIRDPLTGEN